MEFFGASVSDKSGMDAGGQQKHGAEKDNFFHSECYGLEVWTQQYYKKTLHDRIKLF
jgi:hypothetical protein